MAELLGELFAGAAFGTGLSEVVAMIKKITDIESREHTVEEIQKSVDETRDLLRRIPEKEMGALIRYRNEMRELESKRPELKLWNRRNYVTEMENLDNNMLMSSQIETQTNTARILAILEKILAKFDKAPDINGITRAGGFSGSYGVPGLPKFVIGLDRPLAELKDSLLNDEKKVLVISGSAGSGKSTLAKMICHDDVIKGAFETILYVTVSGPSSLKTIARDLRKHYRKDHYEFRTDEEAKNYIEELLKGMGPGNKLLVLDDVSFESGSLVMDLNFQIQGFKILVTSRLMFQFHGSACKLALLDYDDARTLLRHCASIDGTPITDNDFISKIAKFCQGHPLALSFVGASLCGKDENEWEAARNKLVKDNSIWQSHPRLLFYLQTSIDALTDELSKKCFLDLGAFPKDRYIYPNLNGITGTLLEDMWLELYGLDDEDNSARRPLLDLSFRNLVNLAPIRNYVSEIEGNGSDYYVTQDGLLNELAIHLSSQEPFAERKRLYMKIHGNEVPKWLTSKTEQPINALILSISTDASFSSKWFDLNAPNVEVLILNISSETYDLPEFITRMSKLKVLIVTGYGVYATKLEKLEFLGSLSKLTTVRFENVVVSPSIKVIFTLRNLKKLRLVTCGIWNALSQLEDVICNEKMSLLWKPFQTNLRKLKIHVVEEDIYGLANTMLYNMQKTFMGSE